MTTLQIRHICLLKCTWNRLEVLIW